MQIAGKRGDTNAANKMHVAATRLSLLISFTYESLYRNHIAIENTGIVAIFIVELASHGKATLLAGRHNRATDRR